MEKAKITAIDAVARGVFLVFQVCTVRVRLTLMDIRFPRVIGPRRLFRTAHFSPAQNQAMGSVLVCSTW